MWQCRSVGSNVHLGIPIFVCVLYTLEVVSSGIYIAEMGTSKCLFSVAMYYMYPSYTVDVKDF